MDATRVADDWTTMLEAYRRVRTATEKLCEPLETEDYVVQSMPDVSPARWHLAHVTWFFETFVLKRFQADHRPVHPAFEVLFNSYYNQVGEQFPRARRGLLTRPTVREVFDYRAAVDERIVALVERDGSSDELRAVLELGLHHEQQHQELLLMDVKHVLSCNPLFPRYAPAAGDAARAPSDSGGPDWAEFPEGVRHLGHDGEGFCYDNETPRHRALVPAFALASRPVTNGEFLEFVEAGGYGHPRAWLADGWTRVQEEGWTSPLYWIRRDGAWHEFTLKGLALLDPEAPVCHVSGYEADAFATWAGARLPTEAEWETAAAECDVDGNFVESGRLHPAPPAAPGRLRQMFGDVWEWTASAYAPYPGFRPAPGALGEYNGKFMCNQLVLRGGSCVTPRAHVRGTYRNFFYPHQRWQFGGIRLARDV